jgi:hypothetical protein
MNPIVKSGRSALSGPLDHCSNLEVIPDRCEVPAVEAFGCLNGRIRLDPLIRLPVAVMPLLAQPHPERDHARTVSP